MSHSASDPFVDEHNRARIVRGVSVLTNAPCLTELAGLLGFETVWIDVEHGSASWTEVQSLCVAAQASGCIPTVRISSNERDPVLRSLEAGAQIVVVPMINNATDAERIVEYGKFPPVGRRGFNTRSRGLHYGLRGAVAEQAAANESTHLFAQIESLEAVQNVEAICQVPGLTGIIVGPGDLSADMQRPGEFTDPQLIATVETVIRTARAAGRHAGIVIAPGVMLDAAVAAGCDLMYCGTDLAGVASSWETLLDSLPPPVET